MTADMRAVLLLRDGKSRETTINFPPPPEIVERRLMRRRLSKFAPRPTESDVQLVHQQEERYFLLVQGTFTPSRPQDTAVYQEVATVTQNAAA